VHRSAPRAIPEAGTRTQWVLHQEEFALSDSIFTALVYVPLDEDFSVAEFLLMVGVVFVIVTIAIAWVFGRMTVRPLRAAHRAAQQVAEGDLAVTLPRSRVTELDQVNLAFEAMAAELHRSLEQEAALGEERRLFIAAIAHDLRTPLFSLRGYLEGMRDGIAETPEQQARYIAVASAKSDELERLVSDLFNYTRLDYLHQPPERHSLDLSVLLEQIVRDRQPEAETKRIALRFVVASRPCTVLADRYLLTRAVDNLLDNALRCTPDGGTIEVRCGEDDAEAWFSVADSGPGIAANDLPHVFEPLFRGDPSRGRETGGAGLGLTIAHRILVAHGGTLTAAHGANGGALFTATIPTGRLH
jgi:signal transduction histidine kinase